jgi:hypothetical protein
MKEKENIVVTTQDWLKDTEDMRITAYDPSSWLTRVNESDIVEPGQAVNLPAAERARMNRARPGVRTRHEP